MSAFLPFYVCVLFAHYSFGSVQSAFVFDSKIYLFCTSLLACYIGVDKLFRQAKKKKKNVVLDALNDCRVGDRL